MSVKVNSNVCYKIMVAQSKVMGMKAFCAKVNALERFLYAGVMDKTAVLEYEDSSLECCPDMLAVLGECGIERLEQDGPCTWDISKKATNLSAFAQFLGSFAIEMRRRYVERVGKREASTVESEHLVEESSEQAAVYMPAIGMQIFWMRAP